MLKYQTLMQHNHISSHSRALLRDMECFPVRKDRRGKVSWDFEDGYGAPENVWWQKKSRGCRYHGFQRSAGCLQIQSVCDGVIEQIGWLKLGGYRIGIRSKQGYYVYYAHLQQYAPDLRKGSKVKAGDYLGLMGNTGYGPEGTPVVNSRYICTLESILRRMAESKVWIHILYYGIWHSEYLQCSYKGLQCCWKGKSSL